MEMLANAHLREIIIIDIRNDKLEGSGPTQNIAELRAFSSLRPEKGNKSSHS